MRKPKPSSTPQFIQCGWCDHAFDARDKRGWIPQTWPDDRRYEPTCPACWMERHGGQEAWALGNNCQGPFVCSVFNTKAEAEELLRREHAYGAAGCKVVPVRVHAELPDNVWRREYEEQDREHQRGTSKD